jgi:hypothetical protein
MGHRKTIALGQHQPLQKSAWVTAKLVVVAIGLFVMLAYSFQNNPVTKRRQSELKPSFWTPSQPRNLAVSPIETSEQTPTALPSTEVRRALPSNLVTPAPDSTPLSIVPFSPTPPPQASSTPTAAWPDGRILNHSEHFAQTQVVNVARNDTLKLRSGPGTRFAAIAEIPADATGVSAFDQDQIWDGDTWWCPVEWNGLRGYVSRYYLPK